MIFKDISPTILEDARKELERAAQLPEAQGEEDPLAVLAEVEDWVNPQTALHFYLKKYVERKNKPFLLKQSWTRFIHGWDPPSLVLSHEGVWVGFSTIIVPNMIDEATNDYKFQRVRSPIVQAYLNHETFETASRLFGPRETTQFWYGYEWITDSLSGLSLPQTARKLKTKIQPL